MSALVIDIKPILAETIILVLAALIGVVISTILAIANEAERRYVLRTFPEWTQTYRYINRNYIYFTIVLIAIGIYNIVTIARYYFLGPLGELVVYLLFIVVAVVDTFFLSYVLSFSVHIPLKISRAISRITIVTTIIILFIYGVKTPVRPVIDPTTKLVNYEATGTIPWYADVYFAYIGILLGLIMLTLASLLIARWKELDKFDRLRIITMAIGFGTATTLGMLLNYVDLNLLIEALIYSLVISLCTAIFASGPLINYYVRRKRRMEQMATEEKK